MVQILLLKLFSFCGRYNKKILEKLLRKGFKYDDIKNLW